MRSAHVYMAIAIAAFGVFSAVHQIEFDRQDRVQALLDEALPVGDRNGAGRCENTGRPHE